MRKRGLARRIVSTALAAVLCVGMMGNVPMVSMAQEVVEVEAETATDTDADFGAGFETDEDVEAPAFVDEAEETTQEEPDEEIIEDEEPSLTATAGDWGYIDNEDGTVIITEYTGSDTKVVIPKEIDGKTVTSIKNFLFSHCSSLTSIEIPSGEIGQYVFYGCSSLTSIKLSEGVTSIWGYAFGGCSSLASIEIPASVTWIDGYAFEGCSSLVSINVNAHNVSLKSINGILYDSDMKTLMCCPGGIGGTVEIPEGVTSIWHAAFTKCSNLTSVKIPTSVTSIKDAAFSRCSSLTSIELPSGVMSIGDFAFNYCSSLESIKIPEGVTSVGYGAFQGCSNLTRIEIPSSVTSIGECAFKGCSNLTSIEIPASVMSIEYNAFDDCNNLTIYGTADSYAETYAKEYNIPFKLIGESTETDLSKLTVTADSVTYNGDYQTAKLYIQDGENKLPLVEGVDYTGTVRRKAAGTTTVKITGKGDYTGTTTVSFTVNPLHLKNALEAGDVTLTATDLEYTGRLQQSTVKVTWNGKTLTEGTDYTLKGNGRKAVGTSWAVVTGTGNYTGTIKVKYAMKKASQSKMIVYTKDARAVDVKKKGATVQVVASSVRDGAKITYSVEKPNQGITVSQDGKVTVKKGTKPGKYRIKVLAQSTQYYKATSKYFTIVVK